MARVKRCYLPKDSETVMKVYKKAVKIKMWNGDKILKRDDRIKKYKKVMSEMIEI